MQFLSKRPSLKGIIFDFDGVVIDSTPIHLKAWDIAHRRFFGSGIDDTASLLGASGRHIARRLALAAGKADSDVALYELKTAILHEIEDVIPVIPGIETLVAGLNAAKIPFAIGSNARRAFIDKILKDLPFMHTPWIVSVDDVARPKPAPDIFRRCAKLMGVSPTQYSNLVVFEDSPIGIIAASKAGMEAIGLTTQLDRGVLMGFGASFTVKNFDELLARP